MVQMEAIRQEYESLEICELSPKIQDNLTKGTVVLWTFVDVFPCYFLLPCWYWIFMGN